MKYMQKVRVKSGFYEGLVGYLLAERSSAIGSVIATDYQVGIHLNGPAEFRIWMPEGNLEVL